MDHVDTCIVGGGVVGLAIGRALAQRTGEVFVVDAEATPGQGVSSRNSEVIHAGIYYPAGSLKAQLCVEGKVRLYEYCESKHVPHARCGKLVVATVPQEEQVLEGILEKAVANGVDDLVYWSKSKMEREEPAVQATRALFSPSTGIVSAHDLMTAYLSDIENAGGLFVGMTRVRRVERDGEQFVLVCDANGEEYVFSCRLLVNSAGLGAQRLAHGFDFLDPATIPPLYYCKGNYFTLSGRSPFRHLIDPVPESSGAGLGVHATIDLGGQAKFGPDVEYIEGEDYSVSESRLQDYYDSVRRYFPSLADGALEPGYAGIRPKIQGPGDPPADFIIQAEADHGVSGLVQLYGIESPGLTSSLAIAEYVNGLLD
jgi:L-2-hydroxyglutarate oxidase LhgO